MDIDRMAQEALKRVNRHIDKMVKKHLAEMKKQFGEKKNVDH